MKPDLLKHKAIPMKSIVRWDNAKRISSLIYAGDLLAINKYVNGLISYKPDMKDHWQDADTTLKLGTGDCEDFVILKRSFLINHGINSNDIYVLIVKDIIQQNNHALLVVRVDGEYLFLDNQNNLVLKESQVKDYIPLFAFSENEAWVYGK